MLDERPCTVLELDTALLHRYCHNGNQYATVVMIHRAHHDGILAAFCSSMSQSFQKHWKWEIACDCDVCDSGQWATCEIATCNNRNMVQRVYCYSNRVHTNVGSCWAMSITRGPYNECVLNLRVKLAEVPVRSAVHCFLP